MVATESVSFRSQHEREIGMGKWDWVGGPDGVRTIDVELYFSPCETDLGPTTFDSKEIVYISAGGGVTNLSKFKSYI
jgi:hypothetical protein